MSILTDRPISHDEASEALRRFENQFWRKKDKEYPRIGIPARPDYDDDLVLAAYIEQQRAKELLQGPLVIPDALTLEPYRPGL